MNITILIDINDKITEDITSAFRIEKYSDTKVELYRRLSNDSKKHRIRFRNTYQVPSGMQVVVDTPQGEKKYTGGQYVPPEQLSKARVVQNPDTSKKGSAPEAPGGPSWPEIAEQFKQVNITSDEEINKASFKLREFVPCKITIPDRQMPPKSRFGVEYSLANISNSMPIFGQFLSPLEVILMGKAKPSPGGFYQEAFLDLKKPSIAFFVLPDVKDDEKLQNSSNVVGYLLGYLLYTQLYTQVQSAGKGVPPQAIEGLQGEIQNFIYTNKIKSPEKSPELQPYIQQLQQMLTQQHIGDVMLPLFNMFTQNTTKEGGISPHVNNLLDKSIELGVKAQFSKILCYCNNFSLAKGRAFQMGMEDLAGAFPETLYSFNNLLSAFTELNS